MSDLIEEMVASFLTHLKNVESKSEHTLTNYHRYLKHFFQFTGNISISQLDQSTLFKYRQFLASPIANLSKSSQNYHLSALREFIKFTSSIHRTKLDPETIRLHHIDPQPGISDTNQDLEALKSKLTGDVLDDLRDRLIIELLTSTGLKVSELISLDASDVFPNYRQLNVGRGDKNRTLLLAPSTALVLEKYLKSRPQPAGPLLIRHKTKSTDQSLRLSARTIQRTLKHITSELDLKQITPSKIRNQYASALFEDGLSTDHVSQLLGHSDTSVTHHLKVKLASENS